MFNTYVKTHWDKQINTKQSKTNLLTQIIIVLVVTAFIAGLIIYSGYVVDLPATGLLIFVLQSASSFSFILDNRKDMIIDRSLPIDVKTIFKAKVVTKLGLTLVILIIGALIILPIFEFGLTEFYEPISINQYVLIYFYAMGLQFIVAGAVWFFSQKWQVLNGAIMGFSIALSLNSIYWDFYLQVFIGAVVTIVLGLVLMHKGLYRGMRA